MKVYVLGTLALLGAAPAAAQGGHTAGFPDHASRRPDYLSELAPLTIGAVVPPPPPPGRPPAVVHGIYLNGWVFGSDRLYDLVRLADTTEVNAFVIDVKDDRGYLTYPSAVPTAIEIGANRQARARDTRQRLALLHQHGIYAIARIVVAKDPLLAVNKSGWGVRSTLGGYWEDRIGTRWVDAYNDSVWTYSADLAREAVLMGFDEIQFDYLRFPDEPRALLSQAIFPAKLPGETQRDAIRRNVGVLRSRTADLGVPFTLDIFGLTTSADDDLGIGQVWEDLSSQADVVLPMVYPSHYRAGAYGIASPNHEPYRIVRRALEDALRKSASLAHPARIRPYLQAFTIYRVRYTASEVRAQIRAAEELGIGDWVLWNSSGVYPAAALRPGHDGSAADRVGEAPRDSGSSGHR